MHVENKHNCTGCGACYNICSQNAISMQGDKYGFYKPVIDMEKCIHCGLCEKICPLENYKSKNFEEPKAFAFVNRNDSQRMQSASGGAFSAFAQYTIKEKKGIVYGVIYDENMKVRHSCTNKVEYLNKMYSSKYVQSDTGNTFKEVKQNLETSKDVLYSGTPCQIAGLKSYLQKDYSNLITIELICHGVPSPLIFEKYKKEFMQNKKNQQLLNINFRSKIKGWSLNYLTHITTTTTTTTTTHDPWIYLMNHSINNSCCDCRFNKLPRCADITIGDFWGVDEYDRSLNDDMGTSVVLINNEKGSSFLTNFYDSCKITEVPLSAVIKKNPNIYKATIPNKKREEFLNDICVKDKTFKYCAKKYLKVPLHIRIYGILPQFAKDFIKYKILKRKNA